MLPTYKGGHLHRFYCVNFELSETVRKHGLDLCAVFALNFPFFFKKTVYVAQPTNYISRPVPGTLFCWFCTEAETRSVIL